MFTVFLFIFFLPATTTEYFVVESFFWEWKMWKMKREGEALPRERERERGKSRCVHDASVWLVFSYCPDFFSLAFLLIAFFFPRSRLFRILNGDESGNRYREEKKSFISYWRNQLNVSSRGIIGENTFSRLFHSVFLCIRIRKPRNVIPAECWRSSSTPWSHVLLGPSTLANLEDLTPDGFLRKLKANFVVILYSKLSLMGTHACALAKLVVRRWTGRVTMLGVWGKD